MLLMERGHQLAGLYVDKRGKQPSRAAATVSCVRRSSWPERIGKTGWVRSSA
jgi:hypothetical protein